MYSKQCWNSWGNQDKCENSILQPLTYNAGYSIRLCVVEEEISGHFCRDWSWKITEPVNAINCWFTSKGPQAILIQYIALKITTTGKSLLPIDFIGNQVHMEHKLGQTEALYMRNKVISATVTNY